MKLRRVPPVLLSTLLMSLLLSLPASAANIFWGSSFNDLLYDSNGMRLDTSFVFEVGTFDTTGGWEPTSNNMSEWASRWMLFDRAVAGLGWSSTDQFFQGNAELTPIGGSGSFYANPADTFPTGSLAYLWVYDSQDYVQGSEWALVADLVLSTNFFFGVGWSFPDASLTAGEDISFLLSDLDTPIFGSVNNVRGTGAFTADPGAFSIQTHVVPEPGSALMVLVAGLALLPRRRYHHFQARQKA